MSVPDVVVIVPGLSGSPLGPKSWTGQDSAPGFTVLVHDTGTNEQASADRVRAVTPRPIVQVPLKAMLVDGEPTKCELIVYRQRFFSTSATSCTVDPAQSCVEKPAVTVDGGMFEFENSTRNSVARSLISFVELWTRTMK